MKPFTGDIARLAKQNRDYRRVLYTGLHSQVVAMRLVPGQDIGMEQHDVDQVFLLVGGTADFEIDGVRYPKDDEGIVVVPAGAQHNVTSTGPDDLQLLTIYAPPEHAPGTVHATRAEADLAEGAEESRTA